MAGARGPLQKPTSSREYDQARKTAGTVVVVDDGLVRGPELPEVGTIYNKSRTHKHIWHQRTIEWWETWRRSPLSQGWLATDWDFLLDTALMHSAMWTAGDWTMAAEVRLRVAKLGATLEDRMRLKISVDVPAKVEKPSMSVMSDYRKAASE